MTVLTVEDIKKLPYDVYLPCVYAFENDTKERLGYIYVNRYGASLKHDNYCYNGMGKGDVNGCRYSWRLYDFTTEEHWTRYLKQLSLATTFNLGEL